MIETRSNVVERATAIFLVLLSLSALTLALSIAFSNMHTMNILTALTILGALFVAVVLGIFARFKWTVSFLNPVDPKQSGSTSKFSKIFIALISSCALSFTFLILLIVGTLPVVGSEAHNSLSNFAFSYGYWIGMVLFFPFSYKYMESV